MGDSSAVRPRLLLDFLLPGFPLQTSNMADTELTRDELDDVRDVFDLFDFWDGRDGLIDAVKVGDLLRCVELNPTENLVTGWGGTTVMGQKQYSYEEFLAIYKQTKQSQETKSHMISFACQIRNCFLYTCNHFNIVIFYNSIAFNIIWLCLLCDLQSLFSFNVILPY